MHIMKHIVLRPLTTAKYMVGCIPVDESHPVPAKSTLQPTCCFSMPDPASLKASLAYAGYRALEL